MCGEKSEIECPFCFLMKAFRDHPVGKHLRAAHRECLVTLRKVLDARIEALKDEKADQPQKVKVE